MKIEALFEEVDSKEEPILFGFFIFLYMLTFPLWIPLWCISFIANTIDKIRGKK